MKQDLGPESSFDKFPAQIELDGEPYYLVRGRKGYQLLSTVCPHQGGEVVDWGSVFLCNDHGWRFEKTEGECINGPYSRMLGFSVTVQQGRLIAEMT